MAKEYRKFTRLVDSVNSNYDKLSKHRTQRMNSLTQLAGANYGQQSLRESTPVNLIELYVSTMTQFLVPQMPEVRVLTTKNSLRASARYLEQAINQTLRATNFVNTARLLITESLLSWGLIKVGITKDMTGVRGFRNSVGRPFADVVLFEDWVHNVNARHWGHVQFCGNRYSLPLEVAQNTDEFDDKAKEHLSKRTDDSYSLSSQRDTRSESLTTGGGGPQTEYDPRVDLWDIWVPRERKVYTFGADNATRPLRVIDWKGPDLGPYKELGFLYAPGNIIPIAPVSNLMDMNDLENKLYNKLGQQARRQKSIAMVAGSAEDDGNRVKNAQDGEFVIINNMQGVQPANFHGADQGTMTFAMHLRTLFSYMAGNLDILAGLGSQAETLGQERIMQNQSNQQLKSKQDSVTRFLKEVFYDIGWWIWHTPMIEIDIIDSIPGTDIEVPVTWPKQQEPDGTEFDLRSGEYNDYNFDIRAASMMQRSDLQKAEVLRDVFRTEVIPLAQQLQAQGKQINVEQYMETLSKYMDLPELDNILGLSDTPPEDTPKNEAKAPGFSRREYVRKNQPQNKGMQGLENDLITSLSRTPERGKEGAPQ